jgi:cytochrome c oxidase cbb3-type subunit I/II
VANSTAAAHEQAEAIAAEIVVQGGPDGLAEKKIVALIAYLQRMGTDITKPEPVAIEEEIGPEEAAAEVDEPVVIGEAS